MMWRAYYGTLALLSPLALAGFYVFNRVRRGRRAKVVVRRQTDEILLVRNALGRRNWTLPGGGVERSESDAAAAVRELHEELGVACKPGQFQTLGEVIVDGYTAPLFVLECDESMAQKLAPRRLEIRAVAWISVDRIPATAQPLVREALDLLSEREYLGKIK